MFDFVVYIVTAGIKITKKNLAWQQIFCTEEQSEDAEVKHGVMNMFVCGDWG